MSECKVVEVVVEPQHVTEILVDEPTVVEIVSGREGAPGPPGPANTEYVDDLMTVHVMDPEPHPAYDDDILPLTLLFENALI